MWNPEGSHPEYFEELCALAASGQICEPELVELRDHLEHCVHCRSAYSDFSDLVQNKLVLADPELEHSSMPAGIFSRSTAYKQRFLTRARKQGFVFSQIRVTESFWSGLSKWVLPLLAYKQVSAMAIVLLLAMLGLLGYSVRHHSTGNFPLVVPTEAAVSTLRSLFPSNPRLDLYLNFLGSLRGTANPIGLQLGDDPVTGVNRGVVQFATAPLGLSVSDGGPQWLARLDHNLSEAHRLAFRYIYDSRARSPKAIYFPGFITDDAAQNQNFLFTDHYTFSPTWTNEFRFSYARQDADEPERISPRSVGVSGSTPWAGGRWQASHRFSPALRSRWRTALTAIMTVC